MAKFNKGDIILTLRDRDIDIKIGQPYKATACDAYHVYFDDENGVNRFRGVHNYILLKDFNEGIGRRVDYLNKPFEHENLKRGDIFTLQDKESCFHDVKMILTTIAGQWALVLIEGSDKGSIWAATPTKDKSIFGCRKPEEFKRL